MVGLIGIRTFWLSKKKTHRAALLPEPRQDRTGVEFHLLKGADLDKPERIIHQYPHLGEWGVTAEGLGDFLKQGTMNSAGVWSPLSGRPGMITLTKDDLRRQGQQSMLGEQMTAVVVERKVPGSKKMLKQYRLPSDAELDLAIVEEEDLVDAFAEVPLGIPDEPLPQGGGSGAGRAFSIPKYGFKLWRDIYTDRQLLTLSSFVRHTRQAMSLMPPQHVEPIGSMLTIAFSRLVGMSTSLCRWESKSEFVVQVYARFALPMLWDFAEVNPLSETTGNYLGGIDWVARFIEHASFKAGTSEILRRSAKRAYEPNKYAVCITDPPYYDSIPYSDLMDLFRIWIARVIHGHSQLWQQVFTETRDQKWDHETDDGELIEDESRFGGDKVKARNAYENGMAVAFTSALEAMQVNGRLVIVFANKQVEAWETLVASLIKAGAVVTGSWPIQTEREARSRSHGSAALSSSVWIVCKKRVNGLPPGWEEQVLDKMRSILYDPRETLGGRNILQYFFDLGINGPDFIWAALGPALEAYSACPFVKKTAGGILTVSEFLKQVRRLVLQFSLGELPGFRDIQRDTQGRGENVELDPITQYYLLHRAYFGLKPAPAGACILYANACGKNETELRVVWNILEQGGKQKRGRPRNDEEDEDTVDDQEVQESKGSEYRLLEWAERASRDDLGEMRGGQPAPLIDRLHRLMYLFQRNRVGEVQQLFDNWGLVNDRAFRPLLQAVRELALRDGQEVERRLVEALATQLRMNRVVVIHDGKTEEENLFSQVTPYATDQRPTNVSSKEQS